MISARAIHDLATVVHGEGDLGRGARDRQQGLNRFPRKRRRPPLLQPDPTNRSTFVARDHRTSLERSAADDRCSLSQRHQGLFSLGARLTSNDYIRVQPLAAGTTGSKSASCLVGPAPDQELGRPTCRKPKIIRSEWSRLPSPKDIPAGSYFLIASHNADFNDADNQVSFAEVWVSDLAIVTRNHQGRGLIDGFVLDASSGDPIAGATVRHVAT